MRMLKNFAAMRTRRTYEGTYNFHFRLSGGDNGRCITATVLCDGMHNRYPEACSGKGCKVSRMVESALPCRMQRSSYCCAVSINDGKKDKASVTGMSTCDRVPAHTCCCKTCNEHAPRREKCPTRQRWRCNTCAPHPNARPMSSPRVRI